MSLDTIRNAVAALEAAGTAVSIRRLQRELPGVGRSTIGRHLATLRSERGDAQDPLDPSTAIAVLERPGGADSAPDTAQGVQQAQAALEGAQRHLVAVQRSPALGQRLSLVTAQRQGVITRDDPCWQEFDEATRLVAAAQEAVEDAAEDLQRAERRHQARLRAEAESAYSVTEAGATLAVEIAELQRLYTDATDREVGSSVSYSHMLGVKRHTFQEGVSRLLATRQPPAPPAAPIGPPPRFTLAALRACYLHDGIGRVMPSGVERFEPADLPVLLELRTVLQGELDEAYRVLRGHEMDDELSHMAWHDPRTLPLRQARQKTGILHTAVQEITQDLRILGQRAASEGRQL